MAPGVLYVVATPLGHLEDITLRALRVLREVDLVAAEDTRHSRKLLAHYGISTPLTSYYDEVERQRAPQLVEQLRQGKAIALIADAGTPGIADPGYHLVCAAIAAGVRVEAVPGPSAAIAAVSVSGLPTDRFAFDGFVPARPGARRAFFAGLAHEPRTLVVYETGRRLLASLADLHAAMGNRPIVVVRELSKLHEEVLRGPVEDVAAALAARWQGLEIPGEVTMVIAGAQEATVGPTADDLRAAIQRLREAGMSVNDISRTLARETGRPRREIYQAALALVGPGAQPE